jgi:ADP-glucose pyrophosphorylase
MAPQNKTLAIVMGGGAGSRLFPLTQKRAKPAVPLAGKYRLVDIPISNCLNSGFRQVYVLTQFNSESLHRHIMASYKFDSFTKSFVEILAAQQTPEGARTSTTFWIALTTIDKNARIGEEVVITPDGKAQNVDAEYYCVRDGVVVVPTGVVIPPGTLI